jgi:hypothetical protein
MSFRCRIVRPKHITFAVEMCWLQRMSFHCRIVCHKRITFATEMCWLLRMSFCCRMCVRNELVSLPNCVVRSDIGFQCCICVVCRESGVRCQIMLSVMIQAFAAEFVWFAANRVLAAKLCCPQQIKCPLLNYVVCSESDFCYQISVVRSESEVRCRIVLSAMN